MTIQKDEYQLIENQEWKFWDGRGSAVYLIVVRNCGIFLILYLGLMFKALPFFFLLLICACTNRTDIDKLQKHVPVHWQYLTLEFNDTVIHLSQAIDTLEVSAFQKGIQKYPITKVEKASLFDQANKLIDFRENLRRFCSDYVGKLKIRIRYNSQLMKEVNFFSICDWRELDTNTNGIARLLKKVFGAS